MPATFSHLICIIFCNGADYALFGAMWDKNALNMVLIYRRFFLMDAETAPSNGAIWDDFNEQHKHQSIKKHHIFFCK